MMSKKTGGNSTKSEQAILPAAEGNLAGICGSAADHVARARAALHGESLDPGEALNHLDEAISCLQGLSRRGDSANATTGNTVLAFVPKRTLRSA